MVKRSSLIVSVLSGVFVLAGCSSGSGPIVLKPVDRDIDGEVIVRTSEPVAEERKLGESGGGLFGDDAAESGDGSGGGFFALDDSPSRGASASGASTGGASLFGDSSDSDLAPTRERPAASSAEEVNRFESAPSFDLKEALSSTEGEAGTIDRRKIESDEELDEDESGRFDPEISPGLLTAGALNDWPDTSAYQAFMTQLVEVYEHDTYASLMQGDTFELSIMSREGEPLANADLIVQEQFGDRSIRLRTRTDGRAIVSTKWDQLDTESDLLVTVDPIRGSSYTVTLDPKNPVTHQIRLPRAPESRPINRVQIALVLDCTGSMGDELAYLKVELKSIAEAVSAAYPDITQEYALVAYRDASDAYVTRTIDFTPGVKEFIAELGKQSPDGGGDTPEAVHRAYAEAADLSWAEGRVARIALHVADAPPHPEDQEITLRQVDRLRMQGVALYPIASSGSDIEAQFTMRTAALLTGAQYLFLTDDSGVGNDHPEPTETKGYAVMPLRSHMLRVIASEIDGRPIEVDPAMVIREVKGDE